MPSPTLDEIRDRKLVRWALAYLAGAWLVLQVLSLVGDRFGWPDAWLRALIVVLAVGFVGALVLGWYHGEKGSQRVSGLEMGMLTTLLIIGGSAVALVSGEGSIPDAVADSATAVAEGDDFDLAGTIGDGPREASIAVLPFENMSADPAQEYFSDGITEEILTALARIDGLRVAARTSAFAFEGTDVSTDSIARALDVAHLIEGSVRKAGDRVRISARMINAETGYREWGETYNRELIDIFAVQNEIGRAVAEALRVRVVGGPVVERGTEDPQAHALVLKGKQALRRGGVTVEERTSEATAAFEGALDLDSTYAAAWAGLANTRRFQAYFETMPPAEAWKDSRRFAEHALELDANQGKAHAVLAIIAEFYDFDFDAAIGHYQRALEANPSDASVLAQYGWALTRLGRTEEAIRVAERAVDLDPLSVSTLNSVGAIHSYAREPVRAAEYFRGALALAPGDPIVLANLALTLSDLGQYEEGIELARQSLAADPEFFFARGVLGNLLANAGKRAEANRVLATLPEGAYSSRASITVALGDLDRTFELLERAVETREAGVSDLGVDPVFEDLIGDPRMKRLLDRLGVEAVGG